MWLCKLYIQDIYLSMSEFIRNTTKRQKTKIDEEHPHKKQPKHT